MSDGGITAAGSVALSEGSAVVLANITKQNQLDVSVDYLTPVAEATYKALDDLQGNEFNRTYVFQKTGAHLQDELTYAWETNHGESDACRSYATQVLPKIQSHLRSLEQIARPMAGLPENPAAQLMPEQR